MIWRVPEREPACSPSTAYLMRRGIEAEQTEASMRVITPWANSPLCFLMWGRKRERSLNTYVLYILRVYGLSAAYDFFTAFLMMT